MNQTRFARLSASLLALLSPFMIASATYAQDGGGAAAAAAPAAVAAPAAAASSTSTASTTSSAASDVSASASTTTADAGSKSATVPTAPNAGESDAAFLQRVMDAKDALAAVDDGTGAPEEKTDDLPTPEEKTPEDKAPEEKTAEEDNAAAGGDGEDDFDPYGTPGVLLAPKELSEKIASDPALKAALDANPELKQTLLDQSRAAAETAEFKQVFANAEEAKVAAEGSKEYQTLANLVTSIGRAEDAQGFYNHLLQLSVQLDDDGNPIMRDGKPVSDGTVGRLIHHTGELFLNHFAGLAQPDDKGNGGDEDLAAAIDILRDRAFGKKKSSNENLTEEQRTRAEELDQRETAIKQQESDRQNKVREDYENRVVTGIDTHAKSEIGKLLGRTDIPADKQAAVEANIMETAYNLVAQNPNFQIAQDALMKRAPGPKTEAERIALGKKWLAVTLPLVAPKIIAAEGAKIMGRQKQSQAKQQERIDASRSEAAGALRTGKAAPNTGSGQAVMDTAIANFTAKHGRAPNTSETMQAIMDARTAS